jgi:outer membrane immunogenic protein
MEMVVKIKVMCTALIGVLASSPALAQDAEETFSGPRIEVLVGYDRVQAGAADTDEFDSNSEDVFYGAAIGYDFTNGWAMFGIEAEIAGSELGTEETFTNAQFAGSTLNGVLRIDSGTEYYIGGRVGFVGGRGALYVKAGYAMSSIDIDADGTVDGIPDSLNADIDLDGIRLGVGYEYQVTDRAYIKAEYRYTDYSGAEVEALGQTVDIGDIFEEVDLSRHQVVFGAGVRF